MEDFFPDLNHFHLRITSKWDKRSTFEALNSSIIIKPVKKVDTVFMCVTAFEVSDAGVEHTHNYIITNMTKDTLRSRLLDTKIGGGNGAYSLQTRRNPKTCLSYVIKQGDYISCPEMEAKCAEAPPWVYPSALFDASYALLKEEYINGDMSDYEFVYKLLGLYSSNHKHIYISHIRASWLGVANQRNKALDCTYRYQVKGNGRPFRHRLVEEVMRGFFIYID